jgi:hypothetical protein
MHLITMEEVHFCFVSDDGRFGVMISSDILENIIIECMKDSKYETGEVK